MLASYSQQHGYTLVLDVAQQQTPVLYANESTNITKAVIDAYNAKSGVPAPPAQPPPLPRRLPRPPAQPSSPSRNRCKGPACGAFAFVGAKLLSRRENPHPCLWKKLWIAARIPREKSSASLLPSVRLFW